MYSTPVDFSFSYLRSAVEASLDIKKDQVDPNNGCANIFLIGKSQVCKFLGSIRNRKSANFGDMWFQIRKFLLIELQIANPQIS